MKTDPKPDAPVSEEARIGKQNESGIQILEADGRFVCWFHPCDSIGYPVSRQRARELAAHLVAGLNAHVEQPDDYVRGMEDAVRLALDEFTVIANENFYTYDRKGRPYCIERTVATLNKALKTAPARPEGPKP